MITLKKIVTIAGLRPNFFRTKDGINSVLLSSINTIGFRVAFCASSIFKRLTLGMLLASVPMLGGCSDSMLAWQEEVKLLDGRVITVTQKRRYENVYTGQNFGDLPREFWLTFKLPEFGDQVITWHENLRPQVLNIHQGKLYVVGIPFTEREFREYGRPFPEYVPYRYEAGQWRRTPFNEIPEAIYDTNLLINNGPPDGAKFVTFAMKEEEMRDERLGDADKKISATFKAPAH